MAKEVVASSFDRGRFLADLDEVCARIANPLLVERKPIRGDLPSGLKGCHQEPVALVAEDVAAPSFDAGRFLADLDETCARIAKSERVARKPVQSGFPVDLADLGRMLNDATEAAGRRARTLIDNERLRCSGSPLFNPVSLFQATGYLRLETAHTQSLAWLLDEEKPHRFKREVFDAFLEAVDCSDDAALEEIRDRIRSTRHGTASVFAEHRLEKGRADIYATGTLDNGERWSVVVEAKIDAVERTNQLADYYRHGVPNALHIFLTPKGAKGVSVGVEGGWSTLSFESLARALLAIYPKLGGLPGEGFLQAYISGVLQDVCGIHCGHSATDILSRTSPYLIEYLLGDSDAKHA